MAMEQSNWIYFRLLGTKGGRRMADLIISSQDRPLKVREHVNEIERLKFVDNEFFILHLKESGQPIKVARKNILGMSDNLTKNDLPY